MEKIAASGINWDTLIGASAPRFTGPNSNIGALFSNSATGQPGLITIFLFFGGISMVFYFISGAFSYLMSQGDAKVVGKARVRMTSAVIGFLIVFTAYWIVQLFGILLGLTTISNLFS